MQQSLTKPKYTPEIRERAVQLLIESEKDYPSTWAAISKRPLNPIPILIRFRFPAVWQQFFNLGHFVCRQPFQHITEIGIRIQPIQLC